MKLHYSNKENNIFYQYQNQHHHKNNNNNHSQTYINLEQQIFVVNKKNHKDYKLKQIKQDQNKHNQKNNKYLTKLPDLQNKILCNSNIQNRSNFIIKDKNYQKNNIINNILHQKQSKQKNNNNFHNQNDKIKTYRTHNKHISLDKLTDRIKTSFKQQNNNIINSLLRSPDYYTSRSSTPVFLNLNSQLTTALNSKRSSLDKTMYKNQQKYKKTYQNLIKIQNYCQSKINLKKRIKKRNSSNLNIVSNHYIVQRQQKERKERQCAISKELMLPQMITEYKMGTVLLNNYSKNTIFSAYRNGATLCSQNGAIYLYGGCPWKQSDNKLFLHKYDPKNQQQQSWVQMKHRGDMPLFSTSSHTCQTYKNYLLFIGGYGAMSISSKTRFFSKSINGYNLQNKKWYKYEWKQAIRAHSSVLYDNILIVYGGIKQNEKYSSLIHFIVLNPINISQSTSFSFDMRSHSIHPVKAIAYHQMFHTYDLDPSLRDILKYNGVYMFGGKSETPKGDHMMSNNLYFFNPKCHQNKFLENKVKGWEILITQGKKPQARYKHTFNVLNRQAVAIIVGGINIHQKTLQDVWILDLVYLNWVQATYTNQKNLITIKGLSGHCSTVIDSTVYLFGGINSNGQINTQMLKIGVKIDDSNECFGGDDNHYFINFKSKKDLGLKRAGQRVLTIMTYI